MPRRFTDDEYEILTICERNGWTYADWYALPENEQTDRLAFQYKRHKFLDTLLNDFSERIANEQPIEQTAFISALISRYID